MLPKVRAERPDVPVIMITAYGDAETRRKAMENGAAGLLTKPIDFAAAARKKSTRGSGKPHDRNDPRCRRRAGPRSVGAAEVPSGRSAKASSPFIFARDGVEALQMLAKVTPTPTWSISDINMPRMDGLSLLQKLQEADDRKSTIIVSAYGDMSNIRTAMNRGAFDFLTKPIDFGDLEITIGKTLRHVETMRDSSGVRPRPNGRTPRCRAIFRRRSPVELASDGAGGSLDMHRRGDRGRSSPTSPASRHWSRHAARDV